MSNQGLRPLEGVRVLDLTVALAGPYAALLLGGLGAEVIHIEAPGGSDIARTNPPFIGPRGVSLNAKADDELSMSIVNRGRNKKSLTLDLKAEKGRDLFYKLVKESDVVLENMSEGTATRLGVGYEQVREVNPKIVFASISAFGEPSDFPGLKGMDIIVQALSGVMEVTGFPDGPPTRFGIPVADMTAPLFAVNGILAALIFRGRTGEGQHVKVSMLDCLVSMLAGEQFELMAQGDGPLRSGNSQDRLIPFGLYHTQDGCIAMAAFRPEWMKGLADAMGQPELADDPRFSSRGPRMKNAAALNALIEAWTMSQTSADVVRELFERRNVPAVHVRAPLEVLNDPRHHRSGAVVELKHPALGDVKAFGMGMPIQFSKCNAQFDIPATGVGAANEQIYSELLKLSRQEMDELQTSGVI